MLSVLLLFSCDGTNADNNEMIYQKPCEGIYKTANILTEIDENIYNKDESINANSVYSWSSDETNRILNGNGIPNHEVGIFPNQNNPNTISEQNVNETFTLCPRIISETGIQLGGQAGAIAFAINSVKFDPGTAGKCDDNGAVS